VGVTPEKGVMLRSDSERHLLIGCDYKSKQ